MIVAENRDIAMAAVKKVSAMYDNIQTPVVDIHDSITQSEQLGKGEELIMKICKTPEDGMGGKATQTIKGEFRSGGQYHFHMETQSCICIPVEDGMDVLCATQFIDNVQAAIASAIGTTNNRFSKYY